VTGYLLATDTDDYIDGAINGAISVTVFVLLIGLYNLFLFSTVGYNFYGISMFDSSLEIVILAILGLIKILFVGLILGGIGGVSGMFIRIQIQPVHELGRKSER
jgi:hypothetical protein